PGTRRTGRAGAPGGAPRAGHHRGHAGRARREWLRRRVRRRPRHPRVPEVTVSELPARLADVDARIADAARAAGRDPAELTRIVVTKFHPAALVRELHALGVRDVGENRQQELTAKSEECADLDLRWHLIGQAQA